MFVFMISRSSSKLGNLASKTRSLGQIKGKPCLHSRGHIFEVIIMNFAQNVCLDDFWVTFGTGSLMTYITLSTDFLVFQFMSVSQ